MPPPGLGKSDRSKEVTLFLGLISYTLPGRNCARVGYVYYMATLQLDCKCIFTVKLTKCDLLISDTWLYYGGDRKVVRKLVVCRPTVSLPPLITTTVCVDLVRDTHSSHTYR